MRPIDRAPALLRTYPVGSTVAVVGLLGVVRAVEVLVGLHLAVGALVVSTTLVLITAVAITRTGSVPQPHRHRPGDWRSRALLVGGLGVVVVQAAAHGLQFGVLAVIGRPPLLRVTAVNPVTATTAIGPVVVYLAFGVVVTAVGLELLFRGLLLGALSSRYDFWTANGLQALAFGLWHLAWPLALATGPTASTLPLPVVAGGLVVVTGATGAVYGVFVRTTGTLWTAILAHLLHNLAVVGLHVHTAEGPVHGGALSGGLIIGYLGLAWWSWRRWGRSERQTRIASGTP